MATTDIERFRGFVSEVEPRLRVSLVSSFGPDRGREAAAEALAWAWENWEKASGLESPVPYLFKVGRSRTRRYRRELPCDPSVVQDPVEVDTDLVAALAGLSRKQRTAVVLVHAYGWTHAEAAEVMGVGEPTVKTHVQRGLAKLRESLEVGVDA